MSLGDSSGIVPGSIGQSTPALFQRTVIGGGRIRRGAFIRDLAIGLQRHEGAREPDGMNS